MATQIIILPITAANGPAANPAPLQFSPSDRGKLMFDDTAPEYVLWEFPMPENYDSALVMKLQYSMASAVADKVEYGASVMAVSPGDAADMDTDSYDAENVQDDAVAGTAGYMQLVTITLTNKDGLAGGDYVSIRFRRTCAASPKATGDAEVWTARLEYDDGA